MINSCSLFHATWLENRSIYLCFFSSTMLLIFPCHQPCYWFSFSIVELILLPYLLFIPLSFMNTFDINDNYILNNLPLWHWWKHLNILPLWKQWQRITSYTNVVPILIYDFLSFFFLTTPLVIISPPKIVLPLLQLL